MRKSAVLLVILLITALVFPAFSETENPGFARAAYETVCGLLSRPGLPLNGAVSMYEGSDETNTSGVCFYFDTNRIYIYGENPEGGLEQYLFIAVSDDEMALCIPKLCGEWDGLEALTVNRPLLITVGIDNEFYYARSSEDAFKLIRSFNLLMGTDGYEYVTIRKDANVREKPSLDSRRTGYVEKDSTQIAVGTETDKDGNVWYKIEYGDGYGYVAASVVITGDAK